MGYYANERRYEKVTLFEMEAFYISARVQRDSVYKSLYQYKIRHDDECIGEAAKIIKGVGELLRDAAIQRKTGRSGKQWDDIYFRWDLHLMPD